MLYFYLLDQAIFLESIRPALTASWQQRSFTPCRDLCLQLLPGLPEYLAGRTPANESPFLLHVAEGATFDRRLWHHLVGELLMFAAVDVPRIETSPAALCCLLAPDQFRERTTARERFAPIQQAHLGCRDLTFGNGYYRPDFAGWNQHNDVARLHDYLTAQDPTRWKIADLKPLSDEASDEELTAELEYARECLTSLCELYRRVRENQQVLACETLGESHAMQQNNESS